MLGIGLGDQLKGDHVVLLPATRLGDRVGPVQHNPNVRLGPLNMLDGLIPCPEQGCRAMARDQRIPVAQRGGQSGVEQPRDRQSGRAVPRCRLPPASKRVGPSWRSSATTSGGMRCDEPTQPWHQLDSSHIIHSGRCINWPRPHVLKRDCPTCLQSHSPGPHCSWSLARPPAGPSCSVGRPLPSDETPVATSSWNAGRSHEDTLGSTAGVTALSSRTWRAPPAPS